MRRKVFGAIYALIGESLTYIGRYSDDLKLKITAVTTHGGADNVAYSSTFTAPAASTTCFSARATDKAGWTPAAWSAEQCTTVPLDDPALTRVGLWNTITGAGYYGPGVSRTTSIGASASVAMRGQIIGVLVTKQPGGGTVQSGTLDVSLTGYSTLDVDAAGAYKTS
jgi:hypothetical protein